MVIRLVVERHLSVVVGASASWISWPSTSANWSRISSRVESVSAQPLDGLPDLGRLVVQDLLGEHRPDQRTRVHALVVVAFIVEPVVAGRTQLGGEERVDLVLVVDVEAGIDDAEEELCTVGHPSATT